MSTEKDNPAHEKVAHGATFALRRRLHTSQVKLIPMMGRALFVLILLAIASPATAEDPLAYRREVAAADTLMASEWLATAYRIPPRVSQELLFNGYSYSETLIALAMMGEGASLNEILELRVYRGGKRWREIARQIELNPDALPLVIQELLWFGRNDPAPPVLHFLPDVHPGLADELVINAFPPTVPSEVLQDRFRLNGGEVENIRLALEDPLGVPEELLRESAGRGLLVADWVLAGIVAHHKPQPLESILAARIGEDLPWNEVALAFGFRPDVLTQGPMSGIYPVITGVAPNTVLCARRRTHFPDQLPLNYDLERLTPSEKRALYPIMLAAHQASVSEAQMLAEAGLDMGESGIALSLARLSELDLATILHWRGQISWSDIIERYAIDMTGQQALAAAILVREAP